MDKNNLNKESKRILDQEFKRAIHRPTILAWMLHLCIDEFKDASIKEIRRCLGVKPNGTYVKGRETEMISPEHGPVKMDNVFDVKVPGTNDTVSIILDVEGQNDNGNGYPIGKRAEYYISRLVSAQKGSEFTGTDYGKIRKTYSIWCMLDPYADDRSSMVSYSMTPHIHAGDPKRLVKMDTLNIIFLNLGVDYSEDLPDCIRFPTAVFATKLPEDERRMILTEKYKIPQREYPKRGSSDMSCIYEDTKRRFLREGREEGRVEGREKGRVEGITENRIDSIKAIMSNLNCSMEQAMDTLNIPESERENLRTIVNSQTAS